MNKIKRARPEKLLHLSCLEYYNLKYRNKAAVFNHQGNENKSGGSKWAGIHYNKEMEALGRVAGWPDIFIIYKGRMLAIELKVLPNKPTKRQLAVLDILQKNGVETHVIYTLETFKEVLDNWFKSILTYNSHH